MQHPVLDCIRARRSTRSYTSRQVEPEKLDALLDAAIWAPSGGNNQTWLFTAIQNQEILLELNEIVRKGFHTYVPDDDYPGKHRVIALAKRENFNFYHRAPTVIVASNRPNYENAMADCALALENIFITAQALGLGTCYLNQLHWLRHDENVREFLFGLGIPKEHTICSAAAVGYTDKPSTVPPRKENTVRIIR